MKTYKKLTLLFPLCLLLLFSLSITSCKNKDTEGGVTYDGNIAVDCDESMTEVIIRPGTVGISKNAFSGCRNLTKITIPKSVTSIMAGAFQGCDALFEGQGEIKYAGNWVIYAEPEIENVVIDNGTIGIAYEAFAGCKAIKNFTAPDSVMYIGRSILYGANEISEITLPFIGSSSAANKYLGYIFGALSPSYNAEYVPPSLKKITLTNEKAVAKECFSECINITEVNLSDITTAIGEKAFFGCTGLSNVNMSDSINSIGAYAFTECHGIITINLPSKITTLPLFAFKGCVSLTEITIPDNVTKIEACALANCANLTSITLPKNLESIGQQTFDGCNKLSYVEIPAGTVGKAAFNECGSLNTVVLGEGVTKIIENAFFGCINLSSVSLPTTLISIGEEAFCYCPISSLVLPNNLEEIGANAFNNCKELSELNIPDSVTKIGDNAFFNCLKLIQTRNHVDYVDGWIVSALPAVTYVIVDESVRGIADYSFIKCNHLTSIYILKGDTGDHHTINKIGDFNSNFVMAEKYYYTDTPTDNKSGWHYVDGVPTVW